LELADFSELSLDDEESPPDGELEASPLDADPLLPLSPEALEVADAEPSVASLLGPLLLLA
jgi:hypothetical protein